jgi:alpha-tubulin suppressor-like RCC1 family protein
MIMSGEVWCWGDNTYNKLANNQGYPYHSYPTQVVGVGGVGVLSNITDIAIGMGHACALSTTGQVFCWGRNDYGQIGDNTVVNKATPVQVLGVGGVGNLSNIISITASYLHSCALNVAGNTFCWGYNAHGQMGDNTTTHRYTPVQVMGVGAVGVLSNITAISSGDYHACALNNAGAMYCWGYNGYGQMGDGTTTQRYTPIQVKGVAGVGNLSNIVNM